MRNTSRLWISLLFAASALGASAARAGIDSSVSAFPPDGWQNLCTGHTVDVKPSLGSRLYTGTGSCWINTAQNKSDGNQQNWVRVPVSFEGSYTMSSSHYSEKLTFSVPSGVGSSAVPVTTAASCSDDPWATASQCGSSSPNVNLQSSFGWSIQLPNGPLSRNVFGPSLVAALLKKQTSNAPLAPVDVDVVRWPAFDGAGAVGRVFWRAPDVSGNRWILGYDIEYAINSTDSAFTNAGHMSGPGAKSNLSPNEISRFFYTTFKIGGGDYYFRVCSANDTGRQCSAAIKAREPTRQELMVVSRHTQSKVVMQVGGQSPPSAVAQPPSPPTAPPPPPAVAQPPAGVRMGAPIRAPGH